MAAALRKNRAHVYWGCSGCAGGRRWLVWIRASTATGVGDSGRANRGGGTTGGRLCVQWLSQGSAQGGSGTGKGSEIRPWLVQGSGNSGPGAAASQGTGGGAGLVWLRAAEAGAAVAQGLVAT